MRLFICLTLLSLFQIGCGNKNASKPTGNPVVLAVNYSKGDSKIFQAKMDLEMEMKLAGQAVPVESNSIFNYTMKVDDETNEGDYLMSFKYDRIQSRSGGLVEMKYDSDKPETASSLLGMQLSPLVKPEFSMKISKNGNTSITGGLDGLPDALKMQVEETMKSLSSASGYPDGAVDNGDSWEDTLTTQQGGVTVSVDTTYTLLDMSDGVATIEVKGEMKGAMKGKVEGQTKIDIATGWLIEASSITEAESSDDAAGVSMKVEMNMTAKDA